MTVYQAITSTNQIHRTAPKTSVFSRQAYVGLLWFRFWDMAAGIDMLNTDPSMASLEAWESYDMVTCRVL